MLKPTRKMRVAHTKNEATAKKRALPLATRIRTGNLKIDTKLLDDAEQTLRKHVGADKAIEFNDKTLIEALDRQATNMNKLSRRQQINAVASAYACYVLVMSNDNAKEWLIDDIRQSGRRPDKRLSPLRRILEKHLSYGDQQDLAQRRMAQQRYSRDEAAIQALLARGVLPSELPTLADQPGEGLDLWSRKKEAQKVAPTKVRGDGTHVIT